MQTDNIIRTNKIEETESIINSKCNDRCKLCDHSKKNEMCIIWEEESDLWEGMCIPYAFYYGIYNINNINRTTQIFNPNAINNIIAMKIDNNNIMNPISEFQFNYLGNFEIHP